MKDWDVKKLGDVCSFFNGQAHEKCIDENGKYKLINSKFVSSEGESFKRTNNALSPLFINDIVMVMSDVPNGKTLAKCFVVDEDDTYTLNQRICVIRSKKFDTRFLYYQLNRNKYLLSFDNGENQSNLRKDDILNCELFVPPLPEQQRIVAILDEVFAAIAQAKANAEQNLKNAKELFESYLQGVFENKGEGWEEKTLGELIEIKNGKNQQAVLSETGKYKVMGSAGNVMGYATDFICEAGTTIIGRKGNISKPIYINERFWNVDTAFGFYPKNKKDMDKRFIYYLCLGIDFKSMNRGTTIPSLVKSELQTIQISFPKSLKAQQTIVEKLDALSTETKKLEAIYQQKIKDLEELKKSVLQKAFSGELRSPEEPVPKLIREAKYTSDAATPIAKKKTITSPERAQ